MNNILILGEKMANVYEYDGYIPVIDESAFIHPDAYVIGNVVIGKDVYIGPGAAIRGDIGEIIIEDGANVQENCVIHMFPGMTVRLEKDAHVGHGAIIHGASLGRNTLIGMGAVLMDEAYVGENSIIGALCFVPAGMQIPANKVAVGNPAKIIKDASEEMIKWKYEGTLLYQNIARESLKSLKPVEPLRKVPPNRKKQSSTYQLWGKVKKTKK